jgi:asparagine synthase (glutamine-hydrolysing)
MLRPLCIANTSIWKKTPMCGIAAVVRFDRTPVDRELLVRMRDEMVHRGPDDAGLHIDGPVGLAHRRLSIVDLSPLGHQPMSNEDGSIWLVFNGEIYNYVELAAGLRQRGHQFRSHTDTEVIIHLYEELGERCVRELNGMFAFTLWDARRGLLFGARDRMGIKPFHYYRDSRQFVCASEIKAILEDPSVRAAPDPRGIADFLFAGAPLNGKTFFSGISELPPGHTIVVRDGQVRIEKYWDVAYAYQPARAGETLISELSELLDDSVRIHCRSDAPLGSHLSGGLDSSAVAGLAARHVDPLKTFSIRFDIGGYYDETPHAKRVSRLIGSHYIETTAHPERLGEVHASLIWHMDQPPAGGGDAGFSYFSAARLAAEHVKVALTGHGGDEIFAGYPAQFLVAFGTTAGTTPLGKPEDHDPALRRLRRVLRQEGVAGIARRLGGRLRRTQAESAAEQWIRLHCGNLPASSPMLHADFVASLNGYSPRDEYLTPFEKAPTDRLLDRCLYHDLRVYLPQLLHKEDRASMSVSLESRLPLLDHRVVELLATITPENKVPGLVPKALLREAAARWLPRGVVERRDKVPFAVPIREWTGTTLAPLIQEVVHSERCLDRGVIDPDTLRAGDLGPNDLVSALNIEIWFRLFIDRDPAWRQRVSPLYAEARAAAGEAEASAVA